MFNREKPNDLKISCTCSSFLLLGFCNDLFFDSFLPHFVLHVNNIYRWQAGIITMSIWLKLHNDFLFWENIFYGIVYYNTQQKNMEN